MNKIFRGVYAPLLLLPFLLFATPSLSLAASVPVLLTFDTQEAKDASAINALNLTRPATFFVTGQFIEKNKQLVQELAQKHSIGANSYSHINLAELSIADLRKELLASKVVLQEATGKAPLWFRAPLLSYNPQVMDVLNELGFRYDSSDPERWTKLKQLVELPISSSADDTHLLASDFELFENQKMSDADALVWLKSRYQERVSTGRPLVILLHPRIIVEHKAVLDGFINYVVQQSGVFMSADGWLQATQSIKPKQLGVWLNLALGQPDPELLLKDLREKGMKDVYLMARDPDGNDYFVAQRDKLGSQQDIFGKYVQLLKQAGVRVHAWLPVFRNPVLAKLHPDWAMVSDTGAVSVEWLSPTHPEVKKSLANTVEQLVSNYNLDGIHLDYVRYPDLSHDYSPLSLQNFSAAKGMTAVTPRQLISKYYTVWTDWRASQITAFVHDIKVRVASHGGGMQLSAALIADASVSYLSHEKFGQEYSQLAEYLDAVLPMAYFKNEQEQSNGFIR
ncbi:MAG: polysaccharide deacetylase family protein [Gammaproteobacteria bacterium]|nr:polysaccharide deacetylase family protein [Gammaproteobacteria bacterium]